MPCALPELYELMPPMDWVQGIRGWAIWQHPDSDKGGSTPEAIELGVILQYKSEDDIWGHRTIRILSGELLQVEIGLGQYKPLEGAAIATNWFEQLVTAYSQARQSAEPLGDAITVKLWEIFNDTFNEGEPQREPFDKIWNKE